jgi:hypothetical protein
MIIKQQLYREGDPINIEGSNNGNSRLIIGFGSKELIAKDEVFQTIKAALPGAEIILCSSAGEIFCDSVFENTLSLLYVELEKTSIRAIDLNISDYKNSYEAGRSLFNELDAPDLSYVLVLADGSVVNGSELVSGISNANSRKIPVTGGLAGDGDRFEYTLVGCNVKPSTGTIVAVGFYGNHLKVGHGSIGGWDMFGPEKVVTKSSSNKLYEIDNKSALDIYKNYLGKYADELPGSALLFPLSVREAGSDHTIVRTILGIDPEENCMIFAGDIPEGSNVRFMKANFDKIIDAATQAADHALRPFNDSGAGPELALLISCIGRKLILGKRTDEEIEAVKEMLSDSTVISGFYSYGEISPLIPGTTCSLHNQTMTITTLSEI